MVFPAVTRAAGLSAGAVGFAALTLPVLFGLLSPEGLLSFVPEFPIPDYPFPFPASPRAASSKLSNFVCEPSAYRTEIVSVDPLLIYIHSFLREEEIDSLLTTAAPLFKPSQVTKSGQKVGTSDRTSSSAGLPLQDATVQCVLARARDFMGTLMLPGKDEMGPPQMVRYTAGQKFNIHHDWYETPQWAYDGSRRKFNRVASFFAILQDNCTEGETYFPYVGENSAQEKAGSAEDTAAEKASPARQWEGSDPVWRAHPDGGLAFRPVSGNALFWVNLRADGTGDERTMHAGLPVGKGLKTAMNIWPRQFYSID